MYAIRSYYGFHPDAPVPEHRTLLTDAHPAACGAKHRRVQGHHGAADHGVPRSGIVV